MQDFRRLIAWQKAHELEFRLDPAVGQIRRKRPALADQIERAAGSIAANISEGCGCVTKAEFRRYLSKSISSSTELENHLIVAARRGLITAAEGDALIADVIEVRKIIHGLRNSLG